jgi:hypothetical protein
MSRDTKSHQRIQAIDERLARLRAERIRPAARVSRTERKRDTRRKILIGAAVLAAIDHERGIQGSADLVRREEPDAVVQLQERVQSRVGGGRVAP